MHSCRSVAGSGVLDLYRFLHNIIVFGVCCVALRLHLPLDDTHEVGDGRSERCDEKSFAALRAFCEFLSFALFYITLKHARAGHYLLAMHNAILFCSNVNRFHATLQRPL